MSSIKWSQILLKLSLVMMLLVIPMTILAQDSCPNDSGSISTGIATCSETATPEPTKPFPLNTGPYECPNGTIVDNLSDCPLTNQADSVNDDDGDGLPNSKDDCPNHYGTKSNNGCPVNNNGAKTNPDSNPSSGSEPSTEVGSEPVLVIPEPLEDTACNTMPDVFMRINIRSKPSIGSEILGVVEEFTGDMEHFPLFIEASSAEDDAVWYFIYYDGVRGWVRGDAFQDPVGYNCDEILPASPV